MLFGVFCLLLSAHGQVNFELAKKIIKNEISYGDFVSEYDSSIESTKAFIGHSDSINTDWDKRIGLGPVEFIKMADTVLNHYGKGEDQSIKIIESMNKAVDGSLAEEYSDIVQIYCNKYPERFKILVLKEGKDSAILDYFLFSAGTDWKKTPFILMKSKSDETIKKYIKYNIARQQEN